MEWWVECFGPLPLGKMALKGWPWQPHRDPLETGKKEAEKPIRRLAFPASRCFRTTSSMWVCLPPYSWTPGRVGLEGAALKPLWYLEFT